MKFKRWMAMATAAVLAIGTLAGCAQGEKKADTCGEQRGGKRQEVKDCRDHFPGV